MKQMIQIGICGAGTATRTLHLPEIQRRPDRFRVTGMYDVQGKEPRAFAEFDYPAYERYEQILADEEVDLVLIATKPLTTHFSLARQALAAGKHVLMEKPMVSTSQEGDELIGLATENGCVLTIHHNRRLDIDFLAVQDLVVKGKVGAAQLIENRIAGSSYQGGDSVDWGVHLVDQALLLNSTPLQDVSALFRNPEGGKEDSGYVEATFRFARPPMVRVGMMPWCQQFLSNGTPAYPRFYVVGTEGSFVQRVIEDPRDLVNATQNFDGVTPDYAVPDYLKIEKKGYYDYLYEALVEAKPLLVRPEEARNVIRAMELMEESARANKTVAATGML